MCISSLNDQTNKYFPCAPPQEKLLSLFFRNLCRSCYDANHELFELVQLFKQSLISKFVGGNSLERDPLQPDPLEPVLAPTSDLPETTLTTAPPQWLGGPALRPDDVVLPPPGRCAQRAVHFEPLRRVIESSRVGSSRVNRGESPRSPTALGGTGGGGGWGRGCTCLSKRKHAAQRGGLTAGRLQGAVWRISCDWD